jgi:hypothetical protein
VDILPICQVLEVGICVHTFACRRIHPVSSPVLVPAVGHIKQDGEDTQNIRRKHCAHAERIQGRLLRKKELWRDDVAGTIGSEDNGVTGYLFGVTSRVGTIDTETDYEKILIFHSLREVP